MKPLASIFLFFFFFQASAQVNGQLDLSFDPGTGFNSLVRETIVQPDGKIVVIGAFTSYNGMPSNGIIRLNSDGSVDASFNPGSGVSGGYIYDCALDSDGSIYIGGDFTHFNGAETTPIIRLNADGSHDATFSVTGTDYIDNIGIQTTGKVILDGYFDSIGGFPQGSYVLRVDSLGSLDSTFSATDDARLLNVSSSDSLLLEFPEYDLTLQVWRKRIGNRGPNGYVDFSNPFVFPQIGVEGYEGNVWDVAVQDDGKWIFGGDFTNLVDTTGQTSPKIARVNTDGTLDLSFSPGSGFNEGVSSIAIEATGKILVGGYFNFFNGQAVGHFARLNTDGSLDLTLQSGSGATGGGGGFPVVFDIAIQNDGKAILGGWYDLYSGVSRPSIARIQGNVTTIEPQNVPTAIAFPNPSRSSFTINGADFGRFEVFNANGKMTHSARINNLPLTIDLSGYPSGFYSVLLKSDNRLPRYVKLIKK